MTLSITDGFVFDEQEANAHGFHVVDGDDYVLFDDDADQCELPGEHNRCAR